MRVLDSEYQGRVQFRTVEHLEPEAIAAVAHYGFRSHGAVIWQGRRQLYLAADHRVNAADIDERLRAELGWLPECKPTRGLAP